MDQNVLKNQLLIIFIYLYIFYIIKFGIFTILQIKKCILYLFLKNKLLILYFYKTES